MLPPVAGGRAVGTQPVEGALSALDDTGDGLSQFPSSDRTVKWMPGQWFCHGQGSTADQQNRCAPSGAYRYGSENSEWSCGPAGFRCVRQPVRATRQHDAYYQRQHVESLTRSGASPNTLKQCQTGWQWFGRVGATLVRGWAMVGPPYWPHWILVGKIQCGSLTFRWRITRRDFSPAGPGPEVLARPGTLCRERAVASPRAKHCAGSGTCIHSSLP